MGYMVGNGEFFEASYKYTAINMLEKPNLDYDPDAFGKNKFAKTCKPDLVHDLCIRKKMSQLYAKNGCRVPWFNDMRDTKICRKDPERVKNAMHIYW